MASGPQVLLCYTSGYTVGGQRGGGKREFDKRILLVFRVADDAAVRRGLRELGYVLPPQE
jgi:hypothetical protein